MLIGRFRSLRLIFSPLYHVHSVQLSTSINPTSTKSFSKSIKEPPTRLTPILQQRIKFSGAIPVPVFFKECLTHPYHGYYTRHNHKSSTNKNNKDQYPNTIIGSSGDFVTSPEISQVFGELVGVWIRAVLGKGDVGKKNDELRLVELGPGRGTMMKDVVRVMKKFKVGLKKVVMIETGESMKELQKMSLKEFSDDGHDGIDDGYEKIGMEWKESLEQIGSEAHLGLKDVYLLHEFLDVLPIHMFCKEKVVGDDFVWKEILVDADDSDQSEFHFRFVKANGKTGASVVFEKDKMSQRGCRVGHMIEYGAEAMAMVKKIAEKVAKNKGAALIIDYGWDDKNFTRGATLRGFRKHKMVSPLSRIGETDLTVDLDFARLRQVVEGDGAKNKGVEGVRWIGSVTQREFLLRMGIASRFRMLATAMIDRSPNLGGDKLKQRLSNMQRDYNRLVSESQMGSLYRVAAIVHESINQVPGFP